MKYFLPACLLLLVACDGPKDPTTTASGTPAPAYDYSKLAGTYQGPFDGTDIRIVLRHLSGSHATGYNVHRGLRRNISGTVEPAGGSFHFVLSEPGDNPYDGVFRFSIDTATFMLQGSWQPADSSQLKKKDLLLRRVPGDPGMSDEDVVRASPSMR